MNSKNKIFIIIAVIVILLLVGFFYFLLTYDFKKDRGYQGSEQNVIKESEETNKIPVNNNEQNEEEDSNQAIKHKSKEEEKPDFNSGNGLSEAGLKNMASSFAERFGSYSNHSNYANFNDLEVFMTEEMQEWTKDLVEEKRKKKASSDEYYGITTKSVSTDIKEFNEEEGVAKVVVSTKRKESEDRRDNSRSYDENLTLEFVKQNEIWKVDGAFWE